MPKRATKWGLALAVPLLAAGVGWAITGGVNDARAIPDELRGVVARTPAPLETVQLQDHRGQSVTAAWFAGQWTFVTFGFANCADVCPANLAQLREVMKIFREQHRDAAQPRVVFVSVDPERDRPQLAHYVAHIDRSFIGITGEPAQLRALEKPFAAFHRLGTQSASGHYDVSHSGEIFLLDPAGRVYARFVPPLDPARVANQLSAIMTFHAQEAAGA